MRTARTVIGAGLLVVAAGLAVLAVMVHYGFVSWYGETAASTLQNLAGSVFRGFGALALVLVAAVGGVAVIVSPQRWVRVVAVAIPVLTLVGMLAVTPAALQVRHQPVDQYDDTTPQCWERESQEAFEFIEHVGYLEIASSSENGCTWDLLLTEYVDVLQHYRETLPNAGWQVVEDDRQHLRAERDGMAFEVVMCHGLDVVWAGRASEREMARCDWPDR